MKKTKKLTVPLFCILLIGVIFVFFCLNNPDRVVGSAPSAHFSESGSRAGSDGQRYYRRIYRKAPERF